MASSSGEISLARVVLFDIRGASPRDSRFQAAAQALYETLLLAYAKCTPKLEYISIVLIGSRGFQVLVDMHRVKHLDKSFKKAFTKLKQMMNFPTQETLYASRGSFESILTDRVVQFRKICINARLKMTILTSVDGQAVYNQTEQFLNKTNCIFLKSITIAQLIPSGVSSVPVTVAKNPMLKWCDLSSHVDDSRKFFKKWLFVRHRNWKISMKSSDQWQIAVSIEDVVIDLNDVAAAKDSIGVLHEGREKLLEIFELVRWDGMSTSTIYGTPRRLLPAQQTLREASDINGSHFASLSNWLMRENVVGIMRLLPSDKITDLFVLIPGTDGSMLMRNLVSREQLLPPSPIEETPVEQMDIESGTPKEKYYEEVHLACLQVPRQRQYDPLTEKADIFSSIEKKMLEESAVINVERQQQVAPLRLRNHH